MHFDYACVEIDEEYSPSKQTYLDIMRRSPENEMRRVQQLSNESTYDPCGRANHTVFGIVCDCTGKASLLNNGLVTAFGDINRAGVPDRWLRDGAIQPSKACRAQTTHLCASLFDRYGIVPARVDPSRIGGIVLVYDSPYSGYQLHIEVDNELDVVGVLMSETAVECTADMDDSNEWRTLVGRYSESITSPKMRWSSTSPTQ